MLHAVLINQPQFLVCRAGEEPAVCAATAAVLPGAGPAVHLPRGPARQPPARQAAAQLPAPLPSLTISPNVQAMRRAGSLRGNSRCPAWCWACCTPTPGACSPASCSPGRCSASSYSPTHSPPPSSPGTSSSTVHRISFTGKALKASCTGIRDSFF